jgi:hypothetical protein
MAKGGKHDPTTMRRAGRPSVEPRKGPPSMTGFADQSARHKTMARSLVRPVVVPVASLNKQQPSPRDAHLTPSLSLPLSLHQAHPNYDPSTKAGAHVLSRVARAVDAMEREQLSSAKLELESSRTFSHLATQVTQLKQAMTQLADAVVGELDDIRADHNAWQSKMERYERVIEDKVSAVDALCADKESVRRLAREEARGALFELKAEIGNATECVTDARAALAEAERRNQETQRQLAVLKDVARASDMKLQDQVDGVKARVSLLVNGGAEIGGAGSSGGGAGGGGGVAYASEADVVALRDWARAVAAGHDGRLRRVEAHSGIVAPGSGGSGVGHETPVSAPPLRGMSPYMSPRPPKAPGYPGY